MLRTTTLALLVALGAAGAANAALLPLPAGLADGGVRRVAEGCGGEGWRSGLDNRCRPFGYYRHGDPVHACPPGWHIGPEGGACWPNR